MPCKPSRINLITLMAGLGISQSVITMKGQMKNHRVMALTVQSPQDRFWTCFRALALLCVAGGFLPYHYKQSVTDRTRRLLSHWPSVVHVALLITYVVVFSQHVPPIWGDYLGTVGSTERHTYTFLFATTHTSPWIIFILIQTRFGKVQALLKQISELGVSESYTCGRVMTTGCLILTCLHLLTSIFSQWNNWSGMDPVSALYIAFDTHCFLLLRIVPVQIMFLSSVVSKCLRGINREIQRSCVNLRFNEHDKLCESLSKGYDAIESISEVYGSTILLLYFSFLVSLISAAFYLFITDVQISGSLSNGFVLGLTIADAISVAGFTIHLSQIPDVATTSLKDLIRIRTRDLDPDSKSQVKSLIRQMSGHPVQITAANFFNVNRHLLTAILGSVTTYLVVLAQFKGAERNP